MSIFLGAIQCFNIILFKVYSFPHQYASKWYAPHESNTFKGNDAILSKIIKEQLAFPSGTATAQLISVLHRLPPPDTTLRRRTGYREIGAEEDEAEESHIAAVPITQDHADEYDSAEREVVRHQGWSDLVWSFFASSLMTVSDDPKGTS